MPLFAVKQSAHPECGISNNAACRRSAGILSLPLDTLIQVLSFANPQDIIALRKVCAYRPTTARDIISGWISQQYLLLDM